MSRPKVYKTGKRVSLYLENKDVEKLKSYSKMYGFSFSKIINELIRNFLEKIDSGID